MKFVYSKFDGGVSYAMNDICFCCKASKLPGLYNFCDFSINAGWTTPYRTTPEFLRKCNNLFANKTPGWSIYGCCLEPLHTDCLGPRLHVVANTIVELCD